jgi:hypothetical protein
VVVAEPGRGPGSRYDHVVTDRWWLRPLVAAVLGALPFLAFVGTSQTTTVNGETVLDRLALQAELYRARFGG